MVLYSILSITGRAVQRLPDGHPGRGQCLEGHSAPTGMLVLSSTCSVTPKSQSCQKTGMFVSCDQNEIAPMAGGLPDQKETGKRACSELEWTHGRRPRP